MQQIYRKTGENLAKNIFSYDKAFKMYEPWPVFECFIWPKEQATDYLSKQPDWEIHKPVEEGYSDLIVPKPRPANFDQYNPLDAENLYLTFLDLDCSNESILDFVNKYGYLKDVPISVTISKKSLINNLITNYEAFSIKWIKSEIEQLQSFLTLYLKIKENDAEFLKSFRQGILNGLEPSIDNLDEIRHPGIDKNKLKQDFMEKSRKPPIIQWARETLANAVNSHGHIQDNYTGLVSTINGYKTQSFCRNLLATIYLQFAWHVAEEKEFRRCKNDKCNVLFDVPALSRQVFHSKSCKNTFNSRKSQGYI